MYDCATFDDDGLGRGVGGVRKGEARRLIKNTLLDRKYNVLRMVFDYFCDPRPCILYTNIVCGIP